MIARAQSDKTVIWIDEAHACALQKIVDDPPSGELSDDQVKRALEDTLFTHTIEQKDYTSQNQDQVHDHNVRHFTIGASRLIPSGAKVSAVKIMSMKEWTAPQEVYLSLWQAGICIAVSENKQQQANGNQCTWTFAAPVLLDIKSPLTFAPLTDAAVKELNTDDTLFSCRLDYTVQEADSYGTHQEGNISGLAEVILVYNVYTPLESLRGPAGEKGCKGCKGCAGNPGYEDGGISDCYEADLSWLREKKSLIDTAASWVDCHGLTLQDFEQQSLHVNCNPESGIGCMYNQWKAGALGGTGDGSGLTAEQSGALQWLGAFTHTLCTQACTQSGLFGDPSGAACALSCMSKQWVSKNRSFVSQNDTLHFVDWNTQVQRNCITTESAWCLMCVVPSSRAVINYVTSHGIGGSGDISDVFTDEVVGYDGMSTCGYVEKPITAKAVGSSFCKHFNATFHTSYRNCVDPPRHLSDTMIEEIANVVCAFCAGRLGGTGSGLSACQNSAIDWVNGVRCGHPMCGTGLASDVKTSLTWAYGMQLRGGNVVNFSSDSCVRCAIEQGVCAYKKGGSGGGGGSGLIGLTCTNGLTTLGQDSFADGDAAIAIGYNACARKMYALAIGPYTVSTSNNSSGGTIAIGGHAMATQDTAVAIGHAAHACGTSTVALGYYAGTKEGSSIAIGYCAESNGGESIAIGSPSHACGYASITIGPETTAKAQNAIAIGSGSTSGAFAIALGKGAKACANSSIAIGVDTNAQGGVALGLNASSHQVCTNVVSIAIGSEARACRDAIVIGHVTGEAQKTPVSGKSILIGTAHENIDYAFSDNKISIGFNNTHSSDSIIIGNNSTAACGGGVLIGHKLQTANGILIGKQLDSSFDSIVIGTCSTNSASQSVAIGDHILVCGEKSIAIGACSCVNKQGGIAIGYGNKSSNLQSIAIGWANNACATSAIAIGTHVTNNGYGSIALGSGVTVKPSSDYNISIGYRAETQDSNAIAIGSDAVATAYDSAAIGAAATVACAHSTAIGFNAQALTHSTMALGAGEHWLHSTLYKYFPAVSLYLIAPNSPLACRYINGCAGLAYFTSNMHGIKKLSELLGTADFSPQNPS